MSHPIRRRRSRPGSSSPRSPVESVYDQVFDLVGVRGEDRKRCQNYLTTAIAAGVGLASGTFAGAVLVPTVGVLLGTAGAIVIGCAVWAYTADWLVKEGWWRQ